MSERTELGEGVEPSRAGLLEEEELARLERGRPDGLTAQEVVELFTARGVKVSEATFRKYVQLGLLPRSRRVRREGKRRGSLGLYPTSVVRRVNDIKALLAEDLTMDEIREKFLCATSEIDELEESIGRVFVRLEHTLAERSVAGERVDMLKRDLDEAKRSASTLTTALRRLEDRLEARARLEREAV